MKSIMKGVGAILFAGFAVAMFGLMISLSFAALANIFPTAPINQYLGLVMFDFAALIWLITFLYRAQGSAQRSIAFALFVTSFAGAIGLVALQVRSGAGLLAAGTATNSVSLIFIAMCVSHLAAIYAFHITAPEVRLSIEIRESQDAVISQALTDARAQLDENRPAMARALGQSHFEQARRELGLTPDNALIEKAGPPFPPEVLLSPTSPADDARTFESSVRSAALNSDQASHTPATTREDAGPEPTASE